MRHRDRGGTPTRAGTGLLRGGDVPVDEWPEVGVNLIGKRYECAQCAAEVLCTKQGDGSLTCCGEQMRLKVAKPLPASD
jgi:hypothetical protein